MLKVGLIIDNIKNIVDLFIENPGDFQRQQRGGNKLALFN